MNVLELRLFLMRVKSFHRESECLDAPYPSTGIAVDKRGFVYFVDGTMIKRIDKKGVITTVIGSNGLTSTQPLSCDARMDITQVRPRPRTRARAKNATRAHARTDTHAHARTRTRAYSRTHTH